MEQRDVEKLCDLVYKDSHKPSVSERYSCFLDGSGVEIGHVVERKGQKFEQRWQQLCSLDEQACQLAVTLKCLEQELLDLIKRHIHLVVIKQIL